MHVGQRFLDTTSMCSVVVCDVVHDDPIVYHSDPQ